MAETKGKALVTGASSGIGRETALRLAEEGFEVIVTARRIDRLNEMAAEKEGIVAKQVDFSVPGETEEFCKYISELPEPVDVLINNVGYSIRGGMEDVAIEAARRLYEVNIFSIIQVTQACLPGMRKARNGIIVNLSSMVGKFTFPLSGIYASTKYALEGITDAMRMELQPFGIRVVTMRPGPIATEFNEAANELTGDLMGRTDEDYKPVYGANGQAMGKLFTGVTIPGAEAVADAIMDAVLSDDPKSFYTVGSMAEDFLGKRFSLDEKGFDDFMMETCGLMGLKV